MSLPLFAYGTLRDPEFQHALFDRTVPTRPATLPGWRIVVAEDGYFTLVRAPGATADGALLALDADALTRADRWEEVPRYRRKRALAHDANGDPVACWVYVMPTRSRTAPAPGAFAGPDRAAVLAEIRALRAQL